jgi:hypothetical protein
MRLLLQALCKRPHREMAHPQVMPDVGSDAPRPGSRSPRRPRPPTRPHMDRHPLARTTTIRPRRPRLGSRASRAICSKKERAQTLADPGRQVYPLSRRRAPGLGSSCRRRARRGRLAFPRWVRPTCGPVRLPPHWQSARGRANGWPPNAASSPRCRYGSGTTREGDETGYGTHGRRGDRPSRGRFRPNLSPEPHTAPGATGLASARAVDVSSVLDGNDGDRRLGLVDLVHHPVVAPTCAVQALELEAEQFSHALRVLCQGPVDELCRPGRDCGARGSRRIHQSFGDAPLEADLGDSPDATVEQRRHNIRSLVMAAVALTDAHTEAAGLGSAQARLTTQPDRGSRHRHWATDWATAPSPFPGSPTTWLFSSPPLPQALIAPRNRTRRRGRRVEGGLRLPRDSGIRP